MAPYRPADSTDNRLRFTGLIVAGACSDMVGKEMLPIGSGFFVAPYIALTARHVLDELSQRFHGCTLPEIEGNLDFGVDFAVVHPKHGLMKWAVMGYGYTNTIDIIALLVEIRDPLQLPDDFNWDELPTLSLAQAVKGERISALGFPQSVHKFDVTNGAQIRIDPHESKGTITEIHELRRDRTMLPYPCYETDARIDGGMSGGPVFDSKNNVCGVVNSSFELGGEDGSAISFVAALWPCVGLTLNELVDPIRRSAEPFFLQSLVDDDTIFAVDRMTSVDENGKVTIRLPRI